MQSYLNKKVLITTTNWFFGPDGKDYKAVYGTLKGIHEAGKTLGFIPNRSHANWFIEVGSMVIMGCQVMYVVQSDEKPNTERSLAWSHDGTNGLKEYERPCCILVLE